MFFFFFFEFAISPEFASDVRPWVHPLWSRSLIFLLQHLLPTPSPLTLTLHYPSPTKTSQLEAGQIHQVFLLQKLEGGGFRHLRVETYPDTNLSYFSFGVSM